MHKVVEAEDEVLLGKRGRLLPSPDAGRRAAEYQERVDFQWMVQLRFFLVYLTLARSSKAHTRIPSQKVFKKRPSDIVVHLHVLEENPFKGRSKKQR